jgi:LPPG:FO 2-phospho-L-lactate transferase
VSGTVVVLAGGTGGAKLARGMLDVVGEDLVVVANTADDVEIYGAHVSPDPDLVTFWLTDRIDERGWGLRDDTFAVMDGLRELGVDVWFNLGDRDLAICVQRARRLADGARLTDAVRELGEALGLRARVLPMSDDRVRTRVKVDGGWWDFQEFMIRLGGKATASDPARPIEDVRFEGIETATATRDVVAAIADARAIVIGPSNPVISVQPILDVAGMRDALQASAARIVAVSPLVAGRSIKGPTEGFLTWSGRSVDASGIAAHYGGLLHGLVTDEDLPGLDVPVLRTDTLMTDATTRERLARQTLDFALGLA